MEPRVVPSYPLFLLTSVRKLVYRRHDRPIRLRIPGDALVLVATGEGILRLEDGKAASLKPGRVLPLGPQAEAELLPEPGSGPLGGYVLSFAGLSVGRPRGSWTCSPVEADRSRLPAGALNLRSLESASARAEELRLLLRRHPERLHEAQVGFYALLQHLKEELSGREEDDDGIGRTIAYMHGHFRQKVKLGALSEIAGLTPTSYSRSFKKAKGMPPMEYLNRIRIQRAKQLLGEGSSIKEASESAGFGNEYYFSRMFKREVGIPPTVYVKRRELRVAAASCFGYADCLRSLGVEPAASMNGGRHVDQDEEEHRQSVESELEKMAAARPDLILCDSRHRPFRERLKRIAPTVELEFTVDWRRTHRTIAELVSREKEASINFRQIDRMIERTRRALQASDARPPSFAFLRLFRRTVRVQGTGLHPMNSLLYAELGLVPGSSVPLNVPYREYDLRQVPYFDADYLYCYDDPHSGADGDREAARPGSAAAVAGRDDRRETRRDVRADGRIVEASNWIGMSWSPLGQRKIMEELLRSSSGSRDIGMEDAAIRIGTR